MGAGAAAYYANDTSISRINLSDGTLFCSKTLNFPLSIASELSSSPRVVALDFFSGSGTIFGTVFSGQPSNNDLISYLVTIDPATGDAFNLGTTVTGLDAIAINSTAIPEPMTSALVVGLAALGAMAARAVKRRQAD